MSSLSRSGEVATFESEYVDNSLFENPGADEPTSCRSVSGPLVLTVKKFLMVDVIAEVRVAQLFVKLGGMVISQGRTNPRCQGLAIVGFRLAGVFGRHQSKK